TKNILILHTNGTYPFNVIHSAGDISQVNGHPKGSQLTFEQIRNLEVTNNFPKIPQGFSVVSSTDTHIRIFNMDMFMQQTDVDQDLKIEEWDLIMKASKMMNQLDKLRDRINISRNKAVQNTIELLKKSQEQSFNNEKVRLISEILKSPEGEQKQAL